MKVSEFTCLKMLFEKYVFKMVYFGGAPSIRKEVNTVKPYLIFPLLN